MVKRRFMLGVAMVLTVLAINVALAADYIGNSNSGKFHYSDCNTVSKMNPNNKVYFNTRDEAVAAGYVPCKRCNP